MNMCNGRDNRGLVWCLHLFEYERCHFPHDLMHLHIFVIVHYWKRGYSGHGFLAAIPDFHPAEL